MIDAKAALAAIEAFDEFPRTAVRDVPLQDVKEREEFQARDLTLVQAGEVRAIQTQRADLIASIRRDLEAHPAHKVDPIWVARIGDELCVVDGFHRLSAFKLAGRDTIPARVRPMDRSTAVVLSLQVNEGDRRIPRARGERSEAAWQFIGALTKQGAASYPPGWTQQRIANHCNVHVNTVAKMQAAIRRSAGVSLAEYSAHELNKQTGWITWKAAYSHGRTFADEAPQFTTAERRIVEQARRKLGGIIAKWQDWARERPARCIEAAFEQVAQELRNANDADLAGDNLLAVLGLPEHETADF